MTLSNDKNDTPAPNETLLDDELIQNAPTSPLGIIRRLGPGLIVAGSIVGSGELIATTSTGAQAGFWLLWLIIVGCVIKVFVQVEFGRYAVISGQTTMSALAEVPGPRIAGRGNWLIWYWFIMFVASIAQLGGIVGGVGQALSISAPFTEYGRAYNRYAEAETQLIFQRSQWDQEIARGESSQRETLADRLVGLEWDRARTRMELFGLSGVDRDFEAPDAEQEAQLDASMRLVKSRSSALALDRQVELLEFFWRLEETGVENVSARRWIDVNGQWQALRERIAENESEAWNLAFATWVEGQFLLKPKAPIDDKIWAGIIAALTAVILYLGRFGLIQSFSTAMVASFTLITIVNLCFLQLDENWGVSLNNIIDGLRFRLPPSESGDSSRAVATALQTFGIIGVGATELIVYPYWCLEKGYGRYVGRRDDSPAWLQRASGWLRVMKWDAWCSMVVYTFATIAFYLLGAAILGRAGLEPAGSEMIRYLAVMYEPVFGKVAQVLFLFGAFAVLYSTFFVANASHARVFSDALARIGFASSHDQLYRARVKWFSVIFPLTCFVIYVFVPRPTFLVLLSGLMQAIMLPMLAAAALYFRYRRIVPQLRPSLVWDVCLWTSALGMLIAGTWAAWSSLEKVL